ncbi:MAG TPA: efflux RND transporter permease subunit [Tepidisphaeraceae bacterium]|jgi:HAE1 family hydrophobic/amphiphilic exporter-1|nr:efflux RND transporter permease subunit [Tepidisphaeraceae bacterium]
MTLPELCIKRPVFTTMLILLPVTLGLFSYLRMGVDLFPNVDLPIVTITTTRSGTSVEEMETGVTKLIEETVNTISGIDELRSTTKEGISLVNITFVLEKNRDVAQQEVQSKINTILSRLPTGTDVPIIDKFDVDASPVLTIAVSGKRPLREITEIADKQIKDSLSSLSGVGSVSLVGGRRRAINVTINARKLEAYNLSIEQVRTALANQNLELPGGRVDQNSRELILRTMGRVENAAQFNDIIVANVAGQPIRIRDLGAVDDSYEEPRSIGRLDGDNAVLLVVQKQSGTNTVEVIDTVKARLIQLGEGFLAEGRGDVRMEVIRDQSRFINASLHEVKKHLVLGAMLVALTILLFLRDWRTMVIASFSIPVSLISTFMVMKWLGFTLNNITMLAMVLAVGIVIDDAVVVHENIFRWMEEKGLDAWHAALGATKEISLAVMATTFSLVVIFLPIAFMSGRVGRFFFSFGITTAIAILMSMLVSFTLTPMLCSRFLRLSEKARHEGKSHHSGGIYGSMVERPYLSALRWSMKNRWAVILAAFVVVFSTFPIPPLKYPGLFKMVGIDFLPKDDQSEFEIAITTPEGWTLERTDQTFREIEDKLKKTRGVINVLAAIGDTTGRFTRGQGEVTRGSIYVRLIDLGERKFSQFDVMAEARKMLTDYPDLRTSVQIPAAISSGQVNAEVEFTLVGPDLAKLGQYSDQMIEKLRTVQGLTDVDTTLALRKPEMRVEINRDRASDLGASVQSIASTLGVLVGGQVVSDFRDNQIGELYDVWLRAAGADRDDPQVVANLTIPSTKAGLIRLGNIANIGEARGPSQIDRYARQRKISLVANLAGMPTNIAQETFQKTFAELKTGPQYALIASGRAKTQNESNLAFLMAFSFSLIFMYMILAAQFESFVHPITILLSVPVTIPFALLSLIFLGQSMTIYSILGIFLLFGIVKKNGILQVDYTNVLRHRAAENADEVPAAYRDNGQHRGDGEGARMSRWQRWVSHLDLDRRTRLWAIIEANRTRLRPILMTTLMLIAGMVPIALGQGPGAASRASMAKVIVGGQALSLLLSLLVTPVGYSLFDDLTLWRKNRSKRKAAKADVESLQLDRPLPQPEPTPH